MILVYTGGPIAGYRLRRGDKFKLIGQFQSISHGMLITFFQVKNLKTKQTAYLTPREYADSMELIN